MHKNWPDRRIFTGWALSGLPLQGAHFMVEMTETVTILNLASSLSLVLMDEQCGTSTHDGLALAWPV
jgi:hypothetical protein